MRARVLALLLVAACSRGSQPATPELSPLPSPLAAEAVAGVDDPALRALLADHWEWLMRWAPTWATTLGDHRYDDRLAPRDAASIGRYQREVRDFLARARALDGARLSERDRVTWSLFVGAFEAEVAQEVCRSHQWLVSARENPFAELSYELGEGHVVKTPRDGHNLLARLAQAPRAFDDTLANLESGLEHGWVASAESLRRVVEQLDRELARPSDDWALALPARAEHPDWTREELAHFRATLRATVEGDVRPAVVRFRDFVQRELLPRGRKLEAEGLGSLPEGAACYRAAILEHLGAARDASELHELGLAEIARSDREIAALGQRLFGSAELAGTLERLRGDRSLYFESGAQIVSEARQVLALAEAALPRWFASLPRARCEVREVPAHEAPFTTVAYYREPNYDGSKPGEYFVNTDRPDTRSRFDFEALSFHESIPGHHLQIARAQELGALPLFRKVDGSTAFVEGWALYTERLADEMGLYAGELSRLGMWSFDAWRAARLVVDTGLHARGWTREQAERFMQEHTALALNNISNEVDRYLSTPGQALAYKVGQLEILSLRAAAQQRLGARFDVRAFHDVVLGAGGVTLPVLRERVERWIGAGLGSPPTVMR
jgi:uncharacterized protein (DUF885 family)